MNADYFPLNLKKEARKNISRIHDQLNVASNKGIEEIRKHSNQDHLNRNFKFQDYCQKLLEKLESHSLEVTIIKNIYKLEVYYKMIIDCMDEKSKDMLAQFATEFMA